MSGKLKSELIARLSENSTIAGKQALLFLLRYVIIDFDGITISYSTEFEYENATEIDFLFNELGSNPMYAPLVSADWLDC